MQTKRDNLCVTSAGLGIGSTPAQISTAAFDYQIAGRIYHKAAVASVALAAKPGTVALSIPANSTQVLFIHVDAAGALTFSQARSVVAASGVQQGLLGSATAPGYTPGAYEWPTEDPGYACIGAIKIATNASGAFVPGTTSFAAANQTVTYYNVGGDYGVCIPT